MGNNPSRSSSQSTHSHSASNTPQSHGSPAAAGAIKQRDHVQRRESIQALSTVVKAPKSSVAPPSASLEAADPTFAGSTRPHSRSRSHTTGTALLPTLVIHHDHPLTHENFKMGNESSKEKPAKEKDRREPHEPSTPVVRRPSPLPPVPTQPVSVPQPSTDAQISRASEAEPSASIPILPSAPEKYHASAAFTQPPRVPLPIAGQVQAPGSPIVAAEDLKHDRIPDDIPPLIIKDPLVRPEDDEESVTDEWLISERDKRLTIPTLIEWSGPGDKIYVTGTFANWNHKFRLSPYPEGPKPGVLSAHIPLVPGTHHIKFIVDGDMHINDALPTTVDFTNSLVNYIEVSADDVKQEDGEAALTGESKGPQAIQDAHNRPATTDADVSKNLPPIEEVPKPPTSVPDPPDNASQPPPIIPTSPRKYHSRIPRYLTDLDADVESNRYARATTAIGNLPAPPSLPMFLNRSILNSQTPMKDDNSVLVMPNHTVLNHLATSSIKSNVLATSATIRYKKKFLTTIMYKPTNDIGE